MNKFATTDLPLAICLMTAGFNIKLDHLGGGQMSFVFENSKRLQDVKEMYWNKTLQLSAFDLMANMDLLKSRLRHEQSNV